MTSTVVPKEKELIISIDNDFNISVQLNLDGEFMEDNLTLSSYKEIDNHIAKVEEETGLKATIFMVSKV